MGLDVYLYKMAGWKDLPEDDEREGEEKIELDSTKYPEHYFKVGYFRSSYNESGFNSVMPQYGLPSLYDLFDVDRDVWIFAPDWSKALERVLEAKKSVDAVRNKTKYHVLRIRGLNAAKSEAEALDIFLKELEGARTWKSYSTASGDFYLDGLKCLAFIKGEKWGDTCYYVVTENTGFDWYVQALEIVEETIRYVLAQPNPNDFYFHWSG